MGNIGEFKFAKLPNISDGVNLREKSLGELLPTFYQCFPLYSILTTSRVRQCIKI